MKFKLKFEIKQPKKRPPMKLMKGGKHHRKKPGRPIKPKRWTDEEEQWLMTQPRANFSNDVRERFINRFKKNRTVRSLQKKRSKIMSYMDKI